MKTTYITKKSSNMENELRVHNLITKVLIVFLALQADFDSLNYVVHCFQVSNKHKLLLCAAAICALVFHEITEVKCKRKRKLLQLIPYLGATIVLLYYWIKEYDVLKLGIQQMKLQILEIRDYVINDKMTTEKSTLIFFAMCCILWLGLFVFCYAKKYILGSLILLSVQGFILYLNFAPMQEDFMYCLVIFSLSISMTLSTNKTSLIRRIDSSQSRKSVVMHYSMNRVASVSMIVILYVASSMLIGDKTSKLMEKRVDINELSNVIVDGFSELEVEDGDNWLDNIKHQFKVVNKRVLNKTGVKKVNDHFDNTISNDNPAYADIVLFNMYLDRYPKEGIYLRKGIADTYSNHSWTKEISHRTEKTIEKYMFHTYLENVSNMNITEYKFEYNDEISVEKNYHPYCSNYELISSKDDIFAATSFSINYDIFLWLNSYESRGIYISTSEDDAKEYNRFVEQNYCNYPRQLFNKEELLEDIVNDPYYIQGNSIIDEDEENKDNQYRYFMSLAVQNSFRSYNYSTRLEDKGDLVDPVQYFLTTSHKGYCMHFASAAVMKLRALGVPARYAYGYYVTDASDRDENGFHKMEVRDSDAHAWVEVYFNYIGWIPLEVTNGYISNDYVEKKTGENSSPSNTPTPSASMENEVKPSSHPEKPSMAPTKDDESKQELENHQTQTEHQVSESDRKNTGVFWNADGKHFLWVIVSFTSLAVACALVLYFGKKKKRRFELRIEKKIQKKRYASAICDMNYQLYKILKRQGIQGYTIDSDEQFGVELKHKFNWLSEEDLEEYMNISKKARFSKEKISIEEVQFVQNIYQSLQLKERTKK